jgi:hypothetical protein
MRVRWHEIIAKDYSRLYRGVDRDVLIGGGD